MRQTTLKIIAWSCAVPAALFVLEFLGIFGIAYLHPVENIPYEHPVVVSRVDDEVIWLADRRRLRPLGGVDESLREAIHESREILGIELQTENEVIVYGRRERTICGLGMPFFILPLIPIDIPKWWQRELRRRVLMETPEPLPPESP